MTDSPRWCAHCDAWGDHHTDRHPVLPVAGDEPYAMDFGDREYTAWLAENLTPLEHHDRQAAFRRYFEAVDQLRSVSHLPRRWCAWLCRRKAREYLRFDAIAERRGGPPPGLSWKVETDWGSAPDPPSWPG